MCVYIYICMYVCIYTIQYSVNQQVNYLQAMNHLNVATNIYAASNTLKL